MKSIALSSATAVILFLAPLVAAAASITPASTDLNVHTGQTVTLQYVLQPASGEKAYTVKLVGSFPADLLQLTSFTYADKWIALSQPGYDAIDNANGSFTKTAGYPKGATGAVPFGTATFTGKKTGTAHIAISKDATIIYNAKNANIYASGAPAQLFDITLQVDQPTVTDISQLGVRATFLSFGTVPTPVRMRFDILNSSGAVVHSDTATTTVETQGVYDESLKGFTLPPGNYTIRLSTLYNASVSDQFEKPFQILAKTTPWIDMWPWNLCLVIALLAFLWTVLVLIRRREKKNITL